MHHAVIGNSGTGLMFRAWTAVSLSKVATWKTGLGMTPLHSIGVDRQKPGRLKKKWFGHP
jgi:hypothetical protein